MCQISNQYLAGFIDGEGTIALWKQKTNHPRGYQINPVICIYNNDLKVLQLIKDRFNIGVIIIDRQPVKETHNISYSLRIRRAEEIRKLLKKIKKYLVIKKRLAEIVIEFTNSRHRRGNRSHYSDRELSLAEESYSINMKRRRRRIG